jgi:hypothetical protein
VAKGTVEIRRAKGAVEIRRSILDRPYVIDHFKEEKNGSVALHHKGLYMSRETDRMSS